MNPLSPEPDTSLSEDSVALEEEVLETRQAPVGIEQHGTRLDRALCVLVPEFSRSYLQQLLALGAVQLNQRVVEKAALKVKAGDQLRIEMRPTLQSQAFQPEPLPLDVVYEDEYLLVVNKAPGMVVHPAPGNWSGTLLNALLARDPKVAVVPRAGIVHRLDKDTSGLMVVARDRLTMDALVALIAARDVSRQYLALAHKPWLGARSCSVNRPIGRDPRNRLKMAVVDLAQHPGKAAQTDFALVSGCDEGALVHCTLHTGRTHQIRVHMASIGHPLVADGTYGGHPAAGMQRQALHAFRLAFVHPMTGKALEFQAKLPADMQTACESWGLALAP
ncbi:RluA family pseudouridine synthase [Comamonas endophytica]|uniref:Pseudouridine synthase n=1 Tax=Comamonas endophytica TaxID=2949090 RepID=A0ABY6GB67_9BURK|nr:MULTISPECIES: RluA family pseudouridine synthase [unclassified Acidovorax]MCD2513694.1 RluA family pseudouridine synthase [Acidovorax sp. D4N7]UYG52299.1 RluA family pseudouridine synthase [Acidovorax sp. 5MLIR]